MSGWCLSALQLQQAFAAAAEIGRLPVTVHVTTEVLQEWWSYLTNASGSGVLRTSADWGRDKSMFVLPSFLPSQTVTLW